MKRLFILITLTLLLGTVPGWSAEITSNVTYDPSCLRVDSIYVEGSHYADMFQRLHVIVTNTSDMDFIGKMSLTDHETGQPLHYYHESHQSTEKVDAGKIMDLHILFVKEKPGNYTCEIVWITNSGMLPFASFNTTITKREACRIEGKLHVDMMEQTEEGNYVYGDTHSVFRISGNVSITNLENFPIFADDRLAGGPLGIAVENTMMHDDDNWKHYRDGAFRGFADYLEAGESFIKPFVFYFVGDVNVEKDYDLRLMVFNAYKDGIHFTPKSGTNTYWTADQHVKPLPQEGMELKVPKEAVAVDFRGNYGVDDVFTVDVTEANPNCLYYLNNLDYVPKGLDYDRLVIRDYAIRDLVIDERHDFYCPMPFEAKTALLTVTPEGKEAFDKNSEATGSCSGTITLPFDAQRIQLTDVNGESTLGQDGLTFFRFAGIRRDLTLLFSPVLDSQLLAYEPYFFNSRPSRIAFSAENITVPATRPAVTHTQYFDFKGTTTAKTGDLCLPWSQEDGCFALDVNEYKNTELRPFNAAIFGDEVLKRLLYEMPTNPPVVKPGETSEDFTLKFPIAILDDENKNNITSIHQLQTSTTQPPTTQGVYSLTGQYLGRSGEVSLKPGLYVIDGKKRIVR